MDRQTSVLIVGAGPTGLTLALTLRRHGIAARVIDRLAKPANLSKALVVWPASLEVLSGLGVAGELANAGVPLQAVVFGDGNERLAGTVAEQRLERAAGLVEHGVDGGRAAQLVDG